ncbi:hypothetical protein L1987_14217 [Smallanthus sonchifolius]|uniref:Uncharacterized protein n=1 Tax=Smallanthus sonchifolius TaxID=185202 RepID=A0ACB9J384_9ASTR|nr:hypothetical protein L1987_14217 [Smallanthus sonchifolius]
MMVSGSSLKTKKHDVGYVEKAAYDTCNTTSVELLSDFGPRASYLQKAKVYYVVCTLHCTNEVRVVRILATKLEVRYQ